MKSVVFKGLFALLTEIKSVGRSLRFSCSNAFELNIENIEI